MRCSNKFFHLTTVCDLAFFSENGNPFVLRTFPLTGELPQGEALRQGAAVLLCVIKIEQFYCLRQPHFSQGAFKRRTFENCRVNKKIGVNVHSVFLFEFKH